MVGSPKGSLLPIELVTADGSRQSRSNKLPSRTAMVKIAVNFGWVASEVVPETFDSALSDRRVSESVTEVVEEREFISSEDIGVWLGLYSPPYLVDSSFKDSICSWVNLAIVAVPSGLQGTSDSFRACGIGTVCHDEGVETHSSEQSVEGME